MQRGWAWLTEGLQLWRRNPTALIFASFTYLLALLILSSIPLLGQAAASLIMPVLSLGVMNTCRAVDEGTKPAPNLLVAGFKSRMLPSLITIGGLYLVGTVIVLFAISLFDGGTLMGLMLGTLTLDPEQPIPGLRTSLLLGLALSTPLLMAYWFAPILAGWWHLSAPKAMFFSLYAVAQNWRAFVAYGFALFFFIGLVPSFFIAAVSMLTPVLSTLLLLVLPVVVVPVTFASFYLNIRDVFGTETNDRLL